MPQNKTSEELPNGSGGRSPSSTQAGNLVAGSFANALGRGLAMTQFHGAGLA